jgi:hypothetical protein
MHDLIHPDAMLPPNNITLIDEVDASHVGLLTAQQVFHLDAPM